MAHDNKNLYLAYRNNGDITTAAWWSWQYVGGVVEAVNGAIAEFKIPRSLLGNPAKFRTVFKARNSAFTGSYLPSVSIPTLSLFQH